MHGFLFIHRTSQHHIPGIFITPDLRVTCVIFVANILILNRWDNGKFAVHIIKIITVFGDYRKLCFGKFIVKTAIDIFGIFLSVINARVDDMQPSVMLNSTSRKAAAPVMLFLWEKEQYPYAPSEQGRCLRSVPSAFFPTSAHRGNADRKGDIHPCNI